VSNDSENPLHTHGGPETLKSEGNVPEPEISRRTVLIAAAAASVNPIEWKMRSGTRQKDFGIADNTAGNCPMPSSKSNRKALWRADNSLLFLVNERFHGIS
jgi:hypothetical protein